MAGIGFSIGMPDFRWKIWGEHLAVEKLGCDFSIENPFGAPAGSTNPSIRREVAVGVHGTVDIEGVPVFVRAGSEDGFSVCGRLEAAQKIPLRKLLATYAPDVPPPTDLTVDNLAFSVASDGSLSMAMALAGQPHPWVIDVGPSKLEIQDISLALQRAASGTTSGAFAGTVAFGKYARITTRLDIPGAFQIRGVFPKINVSHLIESLCDQKAALPGGFDFVLTNASLLIAKQGDNLSLLAGASIPGFGTLMFQVKKTAATGWGFAFGMSLGAGRISKLPGLGGLRSIDDSFKLEKVLVVASSFADAAFTFPDMAQLNRPQLGTGNLALPSQASGVVAGLMMFAEWRLDAGSKEQGLVRSLLGLGEVQQASLVIGADPMKDFRLHVSEQGTIQKHPFRFKFGVELAGGKPTFFLTGSLAANIQGHPQTFDLTTAFVPSGAFLAATVQGGTAIDCGPFKLSNLALQVGVNWAGVPSLGVAATIDVKTFESSIAVFFDSTDPSRSLVAGSLGDLTAKDVMGALVGGNLHTPIDEVLEGIAIQGTHRFTIAGDLTDELDGLQIDKVSAAFAAAGVTIPSASTQVLLVVNKKGQRWHLTDLTVMRHYQLKRAGDRIQVEIAPQFYFAPMPTFIGTIKYPQGFYLNAAISMFGFDAKATIDISRGRGFAVDAQMDRIVLVNDRLFSITAARGGGGPKVSIATFSQADNPVPEYRLPHVYINGQLTILGIKNSVYATASTAGLSFELAGNLVPGVHFDVDARFGKSSLEAGGQVKIGVGTIDLGPLGKAKINTDISASIDIDIDTDVELMMEASFDFAGQRVNLGRFQVDASEDALVKLPATLTKKMEAGLRNLFGDAARWANAVGAGVIDGVSDTEKVFKDVYKKSDKEAKELARTASKGVNKAEHAVEHEVSKDVKKVKKVFKKIF